MPDPTTEPRRRWPWIAAFAVVLGAVALVLVRSLATAVYSQQADDAYYLHYMRAVAEHGLSAFPGLFEWRNAAEERWIHPPPSRLGYIVPTALWAKAFGASLVSLSKLSVAAHLGTTLAAWLFGRRARGEAFGLALASLVGFSPLLLGLGRLALMDSYATLCLFLCVWAFWELAQDPGSGRKAALFGVSLFWLVITKELAVLLLAPFAAWVLLERFAFRRELPWARLALAVVLPGVASAGLVLLAAGGVAPLLETARTILETPRTNAYTLAYCSGPWYRYVVDYVLVAPFVTLLGIVGVGAAIARARAGDVDRLQLFLVVVLAVTLAVDVYVMKNLRYATILALPLCGLALGALDVLLPRRHRTAWLLACVAVLCVLRWQSFVELWERNPGYDPVSAYLLGVRGFVPTGQ